MPRLSIIQSAREMSLLKEVLPGVDQLVIPLFQRGYIWTKEEIQDLWDDLMALSDDEQHFLGTILISQSDDRGNLGQYEVIDGQQRIMTIILFLAALDDRYQREGMSSRLEDYYHCRGTTDSTRRWLKLKLGSAHSYFEEFLKTKRKEDKCGGRPKLKERRNIYDNYLKILELIDEQLARWTERSKRVEFLNMVVKKMEDIVVIRVVVPSNAEAYSVFETLNDRGMTLSPADLLKNFTLSRVGQEHINEALKVWSSMIDGLSEADQSPTRFIRHFWLSRYDFVRKKDLYRGIKIVFGSSDSKSVLHFLSDLSDASKEYIKLLRPLEEDWANNADRDGKIFKSLRVLSAMNVYQCYPFLMILFLAQRSGQITMGKLIETVEFIKKFSFRYSVVGTSPSGLESMFSYAARQLHKADSKLAAKGAIDTLIDHLHSKSSKDEQFIDSLGLFDLSGGNKGLVMNVLKEINFAGTHNELTTDAVDIEHITPQKYSDAYPNLTAEAEEYICRLGNLTLLAHGLNKKIGNKKFEEKIPYYQQSEVKLTRDLVEYHDWSLHPIENICKRHSHLVGIITELYALPKVEELA